MTSKDGVPSFVNLSSAYNVTAGHIINFTEEYGDILDNITMQLQQRVAELERSDKYMKRNVEDFYFVSLTILTFGKSIICTNLLEVFIFLNPFIEFIYELIKTMKRKKTIS